MKMKKYIAPATEIVHVKVENELLASSPNPGVTTGDDLGDEYQEEDITYSKPVISDIWADGGDTENEW